MHACMHACMFAASSYITYINLSENIPLSWCIHCTWISYNNKRNEWKNDGEKRTPLNNTWKYQQNFSDTFHKMCAFYSVNAFGRLLWTSHSVKFFFVLLLLSLHTQRKNGLSESWMNTTDVIWLTPELFPLSNLYSAFAKRNASNYCQMYIDDIFFAKHTRKTAQIRFCCRIFSFRAFFFHHSQEPVQIGWISFV